MKPTVAITLIIVGGVLIAAPVAALVIESSTYRSALVEYFQQPGDYSRNIQLGNARVNPAYFWFCGLIGLGLVAIGIRATWHRTTSSAT